MRSVKAEPGAPASGTVTAGAEPGPDLSLPPPPRIGRYRVLERIGTGGMARVYRVVDEGSGRQVALKQLRVAKEDRRQQSAVLFEREFQTLVQLAHPRVIEVYDYGVADGDPYYTMELLDGGDLRSRSPLPWREACELLFDVCSSLALLHARRLVHRDITPRNVRCTQAGRAKLIDFGAMVAMGPGRQVVGTPAFVAPEVLHRSSLDARTDLYSLGATLYYALTGRAPFSARELSSMLEALSSPPPAPSMLVADIPPALDRLVMSMISLEPALRPRGAYEVMQRLLAIAGIDRAEPASVAQAYLASPVLVGREVPLAAFRRHLQRALRGHGSAMLIEADAGLGRSRMLDAFAIEAKLVGATALRAAASREHERLGVGRALAAALIAAQPEAAAEAARELDAASAVFELPGEPADAAGASRARALRPYPEVPAEQLTYQAVLTQWFLRVARHHPLLLAVDDVDRLDDASVALLATLAHRSRREHVLLALTAEPGARPDTPFGVLAKQATPLPLAALDRTETETLLMSVFGDVPNAGLLAERLHAVAAGRPRDCMAIVQHLVTRGVIAYDGGSWTLPAQLAASDLPSRTQDVYRARVAALEARPRRLAELQALAITDGFRRADYALLDPGLSEDDLDASLAALLAQEIVREGGEELYSLSHRAVRDALLDGIPEARRAELHAALAEHAERTERPALVAIWHLFQAGLDERALDRLSGMLQGTATPQDIERTTPIPLGDIASMIDRALETAERLQRSKRERCELRRWLFLFSLVTDDRWYRKTAAAWLAQLEQDSGLAAYRALDGVADPMQRLMQALQTAAERHAATPQHERVYAVDEAIRYLVYYVVISIAVGARTYDAHVIPTLPALLEPFAPLSPVVHAMWQNAIATYEVGCGKPRRAYQRWEELYAKLEHMDPGELQGLDLVRNAIAYGLGTIDAQIGRDRVGHWAAVLDKDPMQRVSAMYLRKTLCLHRGDFQSAERFRRKAELLSLQSTVRQMFSNTLIVELNIAALTLDLAGVKQIADRIAPLAEQYDGWKPYAHLSQVYFHRLRGDLASARAECERALERIAPQGEVPAIGAVAFCPLATSYIDVLGGLGEHQQARAFGLKALAACDALEMEGLSDEVARALALAEGRLGDLAGAAARLDEIIERQQQYGAHGLILGATYEARTRIAIWAGDRQAVEHFGQLAAREYRFGRESPLGARYEQLVHEARLAGIHALPQLGSFGATQVGTTALGGSRATLDHSVHTAFKSAEHPAARAEVALGLLCEAYAAKGGHLYVLREQGLVLACSLDAQPDPQLDPLVQGFWQDHLLEPDLPTAFIPEDRPQVLTSTQSWTDGRGTPFSPLLIGCVVEGVTMHVGVAVLIPGGSADRNPGATQITASVGSYLLASGDARGVQA